MKSALGAHGTREIENGVTGQSPAGRAVAPCRWHGELCAALLALYRIARGAGPHYSIMDALTAERGFVVQAGPFAGMAYLPLALGSGVAPKLLGCYEEELHPVLSRVLRRQYEEIVNIGSGEGYYTVGLALRMADVPVHAFDISLLARRCCSLLARVNGVHSRVQVGGRCNAARLRALTRRRALVVCDCEGFEEDLLRPDQAAGLETSDILVELHDFLRPGLSAKILSRFRGTHWIEIYDTCDRDPARYPALSALSAPYRRLAVSEGRPCPMQWAFMTSKAIFPQQAS